MSGWLDEWASELVIVRAIELGLWYRSDKKTNQHLSAPKGVLKLLIFVKKRWYSPLVFQEELVIANTFSR